MRKRKNILPAEARLEALLSSLGATEVVVILVDRKRSLFSCKYMLVQYKKESKRIKIYQNWP